jgi:hypothetical protein
MQRCYPFLLLLMIVISGCSEKPESLETANTATTEKPELTNPNAVDSASCVKASNINVHCGFSNPEDLVMMPHGDALLVSEMGEFRVHPPGALALLNLNTGLRESIEINWQTDERWGDSACAAPDASLFSPHGIDLTQRADGRHQLLVVNHGGREAVEFFELSEIDNEWQVTWKGCAIPPGDPYINDVAGLLDGGFLVTHMWDKTLPFETVVEKLLGGEKVGWVYEWQIATGFTMLPNSVEQMPNGIAVNADNSKIFINVYIGNKTIRMDRATGVVDGSFEVQQPDNITVDENGDLWVASHKHDPINQTCTQPGVCLLPFEIVKVNPQTLEKNVVLSHEGAPMGFSTVALKVGDAIYMGSAHGDRIAQYALGSDD